MGFKRIFTKIFKPRSNGVDGPKAREAKEQGIIDLPGPKTVSFLFHRTINLYEKESLRNYLSKGKSETEGGE